MGNTDFKKEKYTGFFADQLNNSDQANFFVSDIKDSKEILDETYDKDELKALVGKVYNLQKIENIYRRKKYNDQRLFAHTICTNCGREKRVFLSNLLKDPDKYGSCICSDKKIDSRVNYVSQLYSNNKKLRNNTSGYTGVSFVKSYAGEPYNKWRAYIDVDNVRTYLGDFDSKEDAIAARKEAGEKGIKWYKENRNKLQKQVRKKTKKYTTSKYKDTTEKRKSIKKED